MLLMPRERRTAKFNKVESEMPLDFKFGLHPPSPINKKRKIMPFTPPTLPQTMGYGECSSGFGETIVASNPFDDSVQMRPMPPPTISHMKPVPISSGKIYPPDQPMVFNAANPNAPPIYPCGVCHREVHDNEQAVLCESGCNFWFHRACTGLSEPAFHLLQSEVYAEWVCDRCLSLKQVPLVKFKP